MLDDLSILELEDIDDGAPASSGLSGRVPWALYASKFGFTPCNIWDDSRGDYRIFPSEIRESAIAAIPPITS
jgi:hypothetical protein